MLACIHSILCAPLRSLGRDGRWGRVAGRQRSSARQLGADLPGQQGVYRVQPVVHLAVRQRLQQVAPVLGHHADKKKQTKMIFFLFTFPGQN